MLRIPYLILLMPRLALQRGLKAVLCAVGLISNHHDVVSVREYWVGVFILTGHELLNSSEHNATRWSVAQFGTQVLPCLCLYRLLTQQVLRQREHAEQLPIQIIAVC